MRIMASRFFGLFVGTCVVASAAWAQQGGSVRADDSIRLIVRADDFGYSHASNVALAEIFDKGLFTAASVLAPGPWFLETAAMIREHPEWTIGVHLTITAEWNRLRWRPVSSISEVPSLVASDGYLYGNGYYRPEPPSRPSDAAPWARQPPNPAEVEKELRAQIEFAKRQGVRVDYLDCHMGLACSEALMPILQKLAKEFCVPISGIGMLGESGVRVTWKENTVEEGQRLVRDMLMSLKPGLWLFVGHPARDSSELRAVDTNEGLRWANLRDSELKVWQDPQTKQIIADRKIELVSTRDLWDYQACRPK
jgi:hypothetical protein